MVMNEYKTSKKYGEKNIPVDKDIEKLIRSYIKSLGIKNGDVLFTSSTGKELSRNALSQLLTKTSKKHLGKSISTTMMRKIVVSDKFGDVKKEQAELASIMMHDVQTQNLVYVKEKD